MSSRHLLRSSYRVDVSCQTLKCPEKRTFSKFLLNFISGSDQLISDGITYSKLQYGISNNFLTTQKRNEEVHRKDTLRKRNQHEYFIQDVSCTLLHFTNTVSGF